MAAELLKRKFSSDLSKNLFPANEFYKQSKNDSAFVDADSVQLPHVGTIPNVKIDRTEKGNATKRADSPSEYKMHEFSSDPTWLQYSEALLVSYDKRASILEEHVNALNTAVANFMASAWGGSSGVKKIRTTGTGRVVSGVSGATGNRKRLVLADIQKVTTVWAEQDIPIGNRYAVITPAMQEDMLQIPEVKSSDYNKVKPLVDGSVGHFMGIDFFVRSKVNVFTQGGTIRPYGETTTAATDCAGAIFWHKNYVRRAEGGTKIFLNVDDAELYGSKMSALVRAGGTAARKDGKGVINLVEDVVA
ncbi:hypothetical protein GGR32_000139 [Mesonia hippocampi]|uniref:Capsid protein n=1 Tax=Mesonia hippocampi TaxID=1628250 RepID=A0A840ESF0_9FLAO|nr:phage capsid protein [Mesonia hippocampi]MBB4117867.1 hypothetical protein [Mesonia hippocampi]